GVRRCRGRRGEQRGVGAAQGRRARRPEGIRQLRGAHRRSGHPGRPQHDAQLSARTGHHGRARARQTRHLRQAARNDRGRSAAPPEAFARGDGAREPFTVRSEDLATVLLRFDGGAKGSMSVGQVCAGHKNDLWFEANGRTASLGWRQERQNELWIGRRDGANGVLPKDPSLLNDVARAYAHLPGGHQEAWADAFCNVMRDVYGFIASGKAAGDQRPPAFATFEDGYRAAAIVDAMLESHRRGGVWTKVDALVAART